MLTSLSMRNLRTKLLLSCISLPTLFFLFLFLLMAKSPKPQPKLHIHSHLQAIAAAARLCDGTLYPSLCASTLSCIPDLTSKPLPAVIAASVNLTLPAVQSSADNCYSYLDATIDPRQHLALTDCLELLNTTHDYLKDALRDLSNSSSSPSVANLRTVLSAAITNQYTCLDGFSHVRNGSIRPRIENRFYNISHMVSNSLAMSMKLPQRPSRREALEGYGRISGGFPTWVSAKDRRLLQMPVNVTMANLVVAKDGSGNFTTIGAAVAAAPKNSTTRFVIYIKAGGYFENVNVWQNRTNIMFVGDGMGKTAVKAGLNVVDGSTTFRSATVAVVGNGFLARDMTFENTAGPSKHQAVALRSDSDFSAFYRCSFVGYQDTLYVHSLRQFYRECDVYGTVDVIFGDAVAVFQNCNLYARKPDPTQKNIFTAQARTDPNENTGISIQNCKIAAAADLIPVQSTVQSYLGRPWREYSRTVYLQSQLDDLIDPKGWLEWDGNFALSTLYYGEYKNRGPGSNTSGRVTWPGYRVINSSAEANKFTVVPFIQGDQWLGSTGVPFSTTLL